MKATTIVGLAAAVTVVVLVIGSALSAFAGSEDHTPEPRADRDHEAESYSHDRYGKAEEKKITKDSYNRDEEKKVTKDSYNSDDDKKVIKDSYNKDEEKKVIKDSYNSDDDKKITSDSYNPNTDKDIYTHSDPCDIEQEAGADGKQPYAAQVCHNDVRNDESMSTTTTSKRTDDHSIDQECEASGETDQPRERYGSYDGYEKGGSDGGVDCEIDASHTGTSSCQTSGFIAVVQCPGQVEGDNTQSTNIRNDGGSPYGWSAAPAETAGTSSAEPQTSDTSSASPTSWTSLLGGFLGLL